MAFLAANPVVQPHEVLAGLVGFEISLRPPTKIEHPGAVSFWPSARFCESALFLGQLLMKILDTLTDDSELSIRTQRALSLVFLGIAGVMSLQEYVDTSWLWDRHLSFSPTLLSSALALPIMAPLYLRGILKWRKSIYTTMSFLLLLMVFASMIELALGGNGLSGATASVVGVTLVLSWLGMGGVAQSAWVLLAGTAVYSTIRNNMALDAYGYFYVATCCLGLLFHSELNLGQLSVAIREAYGREPSETRPVS
jgi:hypothetical protein